MKRKTALIIVVIVIVVILMLAFVLHSTAVKNTPGNGGSVVVAKIYTVEFKDKTSSNPNYGKGSNGTYYLNGDEAPDLILQRGMYYEFVNKSNEPIYFTTSKSGGSGSPNPISKNLGDKFKGLQNGTIFLFISDDLPDVFYYQSNSSTYSGGKITII